MKYHHPQSQSDTNQKLFSGVSKIKYHDKWLGDIAVASSKCIGQELHIEK